ncbi:MAG TPA: IclR family transcriptional regulator [Pseudonocardia sp.]|nr:IclR family transcriptional regulator [Pseudonocardia sp.]
MQNRPTYAIDSVDHALHLVTLLQQEGPLRVSEAAQRLGVARSTAHRLLAMLVYRDFAEQAPDRRYRAGPALRRPAAVEPASRVRRLALAHLRALTESVGETTNLMTVLGDRARFVATVECTQVLRVGDREGRMLPAHLTSGGKAVLAARPDADVVALYTGPAATADPPVPDLPALLRELGRIRRRGFAVNDGGTEPGVTAIGRVLRDPAGPASMAVSIAMPATRFSRDRLAGWARSLAATAQRIEDELAAPR